MRRRSLWATYHRALLVRSWSNVTIGPSTAAVAAIAVGNTLAPVCAYLLLRRVGFHVELDRLRDALALVFLGALAGMLVGATVAALMPAGALPASDFWRSWSVWWTGDAMGVLVVAPFLLVMRSARLPRGVRPYRWIEAAALLASTFLVTVVDPARRKSPLMPSRGGGSCALPGPSGAGVRDVVKTRLPRKTMSPVRRR